MFKLSKVKLLIVILLITSMAFVGTQKGHYRIKLKEYDITLIPNNCKDSILKIDQLNNRFFKIFLKDCKGALKLECYRLADSLLQEEGSYISSLALLSSYTNSVNPTTGETKVAVSKYYQPLRNGVWRYYDYSGIRTETYKRGVVVSVSSSLDIPHK